MTRFVTARRLSAALTALALCGAVAVAVVPAERAAAYGTTIDVRTREAALLASRQHVRPGVAVLDRVTGTAYLAGQARAEFGGASVVKLFVAARLLARRQMTGRTATLAYSMITRSDNNAMQRLLPKVGGTAVVDWAERYFGLVGQLGSPPLRSKASCWGNTHITAYGIVRFLDRMHRNTLIGPWLTRAMHHWQAHAADGLDQRFGFAVAASGAGVKQGEGHCSSDSNGSILNSVAFVDGDRFAVAILTDSHICCNRGGFNLEQSRLVTRMARLLLPNGHVDLPQRHDPRGGVTMTADGTTVSVRGWVVDPDRPKGPTPVRVTEKGRVLRSGSSSIVDATVNRRHKLTGRHSFSLSVPAAAGRHTLCVVFVDVGQGRGDQRLCRTVTVAG